MTHPHNNHPPRPAHLRLTALASLALLLAGCSDRTPQDTLITPEDTLIDPTRIPWHERDRIAAVASHRGDQAFVSWFADRLPRRQFTLVNLTTLEERPVDQEPERRGLGPGGKWSPDDRYFASVADPGDWTVGIVDIARGTWRPIPKPTLDRPGSVYTSSPAWSPDGDELLFDAVVEDERGRAQYFVCLYRVGEDHSVVLTDGYIRHSGNPFWGKWFAFARSSGEPHPRGALRRRFFVAELSRQSGTPPRERESLPDKVVDRISVSPDGTRAVALCLPANWSESHQGDPGHHIYVIANPEAPRARLLTDTLFTWSYPLEWAAHSDRIAAHLWEQADERSPQLCVVDVTSGDLALLRDLQGRPIRGQGAQWVDDDRRLIYWRRGEFLTGEMWCYVLDTKENYRLLPPPQDPADRWQQLKRAPGIQ